MQALRQAAKQALVEYDQHSPLAVVMEELRIALKQPERQALQAAGTHPAPCARHCEAKAYEIEIRGLKSALRAALEQPEQEPVAWMSQAGNFLSPIEFTVGEAALYGWTPVYTQPPQRKQLTTEERNSIVNDALRGHASTRDAIDWAIRHVECHYGIGQTP